MMNQIKNLSDVKAFASLLISEGSNFHPDDDFTDYINLSTGKPTYSLQEAEIRNNLMDQSFSVCEKAKVDIYDVMLEITLKQLRLDHLIPLPSQISESRI